MADLQKEYEQDTWKSALRSEIIIALIGDPIEKENALEKIGYYYECYAPATLYKYYPDTIMLLAPGDRDHILSGVFNQFLSALTEPVE